jgi:hypothetical protein
MTGAGGGGKRGQKISIASMAGGRVSGAGSGYCARVVLQPGASALVRAICGPGGRLGGDGESDLHLKRGERNRRLGNFSVICGPGVRRGGDRGWERFLHFAGWGLHLERGEWDGRFCFSPPII